MVIQKVRDPVKFVLDGRWPGEGTLVSHIDRGVASCYVIKLTAPCKEHEAGKEIIVFEDEIINPEKQ